MKTALVNIPNHEFKTIWPMVQPLFRKLVNSSGGRFLIHPIVKKVYDGEWRLWVVWKPSDKKVMAIILTQIYIEMSGMKICRISGVVGEHRDEWVEHLEVLEEWSRDEGCAILEAWARPGWAKILKEYKRTHILLEKRLNARRIERNDSQGNHESPGAISGTP